MVQARQITPSEAPLPNQSPLVRAETRQYVENQKRADLNRNVSQYMFWGATTVMAGMAAALATSGLALPWIIGGAAASLATFFGSVMFSRRATEIAERGNVLYSDIDSQHQAKRMVQAFAKAQSTSVGAAENEDAVPFTRRDGRSWAGSVENAPASRSGNWADRVTAQSAVEDAQTLANLQSR